MNFKAAPQSYIWPGGTFGLRHMVTGHLKNGKKEERRKSAFLESFHPEPKEFGCTGTTLFNVGKRHLRAALSALQLIRESQGRLKKPKNSTVCPKIHALPGSGLRHFRRASRKKSTKSSISAPLPFGQVVLSLVLENYTEVHITEP